MPGIKPAERSIFEIEKKTDVFAETINNVLRLAPDIESFSSKRRFGFSALISTNEFTYNSVIPWIK